MRATRFYKPDTPLKIEDVRKPKLESGDVLVEIRACGICGSDVHIYHGETIVGKTPITLGHEFSGIVAEVAEGVEEPKVGDRVSVDGLIFCGRCRNCITGRDNVCKYWRFYGISEDGGLAEYCKVHARNCIKLPDKIPFDYGAILTDAVATPYHALRIARISVGDTVAIYGIGGLGIHAVQIARLSGARVIAVDAVEDKLRRAKEAGAEHTINARTQNPPKKIQELTNGEGADVAVEIVGKTETIRNTIDSVRRGGRIVLVGLCAEEVRLDTRLIVRRGINILGSYSYCKSDIQRAIELTERGMLDLSRSITHKLSLEEVNKGIEIIDKGVGNPLRVIVETN